VQVTLYNPGANATGVYDQPIGVNSSHYADLINANWSNAVIEYTANNTPVNGWIESGNSNASVDTLLWLRLASLAPNTGTNVSIYFGPKDWDNLSANGYLGENPTLSRTYGALDNGRRVFDAYANFSGTSLPTGWTTLGNWAGSVDQGLSLAASYQTGAIEAPFVRPYATDVVVDASAHANAPVDPLYLFVSATPGFSSQYQFFPSAYALEVGASGSSAVGIETSNATGALTSRGASVTAPVSFAQGSHAVGLAWQSSNATESASVDYFPVVSQVDGTNAPIADFGLGAYCSANCSSWNVSWVRARNAPDPMPVVSDEAFLPFGVVASGAPLATDTDQAVAFDCNASSDPVTFHWTFGDGQSVVGRSALHAFVRPGNYLATCSVTNTAGAVGVASAPVVINAPPAILLFQAGPSQFPLGASLNLVANITGGTAPFVYSYVGLPSGCTDRNTPALSCLPGETGTFAIEVSVKDAAGESTTAWITVTITTPAPASGANPLTPAEGYALAGGVAGVVVLAGVLPVLVWSRRRPPGDRRGGSEDPAEPSTEPREPGRPGPGTG
jgi:PKD domain